MINNWALTVFLTLGGICLSVASGLFKDWLKTVIPKKIAVIGSILFISGAAISIIINSKKVEYKNSSLISIKKDSSSENKEANYIFPLANLRTENLKGKVASVSSQEFYADLVNGEIVKKNINSSNNKANILIKFNEQGYISEVDYYEDSIFTVKHKDVTYFNSNGLPIQRKYYRNEEIVSTESINYTNNEIESITSDFKGNSFTPSMKKKYGKLGLLEVIYIDSIGSKLESEQYIYNDNGELHKKKSIDKFGNSKEIVIFDYDYNVNSITQYLDTEVGPVKIIYLRDPNKQITEYYWIKEAKIIKSTNTYMFDSCGNWIKKNTITKINGSDIYSVIERKINYYP